MSESLSNIVICSVLSIIPSRLAEHTYTNDIGNCVELGVKNSSNLSNLVSFAQNMTKVIKDFRVFSSMQTRVAVGLILIAIIGTALVSFTSLTPDLRQAFAGIGLTSGDVAKFMIIRVNSESTNGELVFSSFSRVGFVRSEGTEFLLESLPSVDKRQFHELVQKSLSATNPLLGNPPNMDVSIDIFTGNYKLIETLEYTDCIITEYFVHVVDSKGKYRFLEDDDSPTEIREVTKFSCNQFTIALD